MSVVRSEAGRCEQAACEGVEWRKRGLGVGSGVAGRQEGTLAEVEIVGHNDVGGLFEQAEELSNGHGRRRASDVVAEERRAARNGYLHLTIEHTHHGVLWCCRVVRCRAIGVSRTLIH